MDKPQIIGGYDPQATEDCERVLVTLLRGMGPWRDSIFLVGGLAPRYIIERRPPAVRPHAGTGDVDLLLDVAILADIEAYRTLEENLKRLGFERADHRGKTASWRWKIVTEAGRTLVLEFLAENPDHHGGALEPLPTEGAVTAVNIPHASMVFDLHSQREVTAELLGGGGLATEVVAYANLVSFVCLKAFAYDHRHERKDAHDLVYCLENTDGGLDAAADEFFVALQGKHQGAIREALHLLAKRFTTTDERGYRMDGPVAVAKFEIVDDNEAPEVRDIQILRQREANAVVIGLLERIVKLEDSKTS
jgi:Nucleotidyltransferase